MTATELLKNDHQKAVSLIGELEAADRQVGTVQTNIDVFNHLNELLMMHTLIEEEMFYPAMKEFDESRDLARSLRKGHEEFERLLSHLSTMAPNVEEFQKTLADLRESVERHIDEEENELFPLAEELCEPQRLQEMGRRMQEMKYNSRAKVAAIRRR
ncbi:MAG TPA: hemerythrin domain-containing protein [Blastocatellia bacterium]|nr:hemerythrin domain-containing protein [Blastocatellia bacterium]